MILIGGCSCGAVRYHAKAANLDGYFCHCRMCQRAVGGVAAAFVNVLKAELTLTGPVAHHMSSAIGRRGFCGTCGTPLTFDYPDSPHIDLTVGSLDEPWAARLTSHFGVESRVPGWIRPDKLPEITAAEHAPLVARWAGVTGGPD